MFLNICLFYARIKNVIIIIKKMSLSTDLSTCFRICLIAKNQNPETLEINRQLCKAENTHG